MLSMPFATTNTEKKSFGFSLLELSLVTLILGILIVAMTSGVMSYMKSVEIRKTEQYLEDINRAIQQFLQANGRYPCAAAYNAGLDTDTFGREIGDGTNCNTEAANALETFTSAGVRIGAVPVRTLGIPDDYAFDAWGRRLTYAVTEVQATAGGFLNDNGIIQYDDSRGNQIGNDVHYVVLSHGKQGHGAFSKNGNSREPCDGGPAGSSDRENCNDDNTFVYTLIANTNENNAGFFDDHVLRNRANEFSTIPSNAVVAFNQTDCPDGWIPYVEAAGRAIIGTGNYTEGSTSIDYDLGDPYGTIEIEVNLNDLISSAGVASVNFTPLSPPNSGGTTYRFLTSPNATGTQQLIRTQRSPSIALTYCVKN